ncbi:FhaA domain-containing protein [candidate division KSB1 bacterium]
MVLYTLKRYVANILQQFAIGRDMTENENGSARIPFEYIADKLRSVVRAGSDKLGKRVVVPNIYVLYFSFEDRAYRRHTEHLLIEELTDVVREETNRIKGAIGNSDISVTVNSDENLEQGHFYIDCRFEQREAKPKARKNVPKKNAERPALSNASIPPPEAPEMQDGTLIRTLLRPVNTGPSERKKAVLVCRVDLKDHRGTRSLYLTEGAYVFGRSAEVDIQLDPKDISVSRRHFCLIVAGEGLTLDMLGRHGGQVNAVHVESGMQCFAGSGDEVIIGKTRVTFEIEKHMELDNDSNATGKYDTQ